MTWATDRTPAANDLPVISADAGAGVTIPDDLYPVEDGNEQRRLRDNAWRQKGQVRHRPGVDHVQTAERGTEDQQPQRRLHHPGDELGAVVRKLLQFDDREPDDAAHHCASALPATGGAQQRSLDGVLVNRHDGQPFCWNGLNAMTLKTQKNLSAATSRTPRSDGTPPLAWPQATKPT